MAGFVKLDTGVLNSSIWIERDLRSVFITALVMAEPYELRESEPQLEVRSLEPTGWIVPPGWYGFVPAAGTGIVRRDGLEDVEAGLTLLEKLCAPDPDSRSQNYEGRRMARINHGYVILNFFEFRDRDYTAAERMRKLRARRKALAEKVTRNDDDVTANVTQSEDRGQRTEDRNYKEPPTTPPTPQNVDNRNDGGNGLEKRKAKAFRIFAELLASRIEVRTPSGLRYRIPKEGISAEVKQAVDAIGGADAIANADEVGLRVLRGQFATAFTESA